MTPALVAALLLAIPGDPVPPSLDEVKRGLAARDALFENARFRVVYHDKARMLQAGPVRARVQAIEAIIDRSDRARIDMIETAGAIREDLPANPKGIRTTATSNAEGSRYLIDYPDGKGRHGRILDAPGLPWAIQPARLLFLNLWSPFSYLSAVRLIEVGGVETLHGREAVRLDWRTADDEPEGIRRGSFWVVPSMGYAVVKSEESTRPGRLMPWRPFERIEWERPVEAGDLWVPSGVTFSHYRYYREGDYELGQELTAEFERWSINQPVADGEFRLEFPDKTAIQDSTTRPSRWYVKGQIDDRAITRQVSQARQLVKDPARPRLQAEFDRATRDDPPIDEARWAPASVFPWAWAAAAAVAVVPLAFLARRHLGKKG